MSVIRRACLWVVQRAQRLRAAIIQVPQRVLDSRAVNWVLHRLHFWWVPLFHAAHIVYDAAPLAGNFPSYTPQEQFRWHVFHILVGAHDRKIKVLAVPVAGHRRVVVNQYYLRWPTNDGLALRGERGNVAYLNPVISRASVRVAVRSAKDLEDRMVWYRK